jgi:hypothetical protein
VNKILNQSFPSVFSSTTHLYGFLQLILVTVQSIEQMRRWILGKLSFWGRVLEPVCSTHLVLCLSELSLAPKTCIISEMETWED